MGELQRGVNNGLRHFELAEQHADGRHEVAGQHEFLNDEVEVGALQHNVAFCPAVEER